MDIDDKKKPPVSAGGGYGLSGPCAGSALLHSTTSGGGFAGVPGRGDRKGATARETQELQDYTDRKERRAEVDAELIKWLCDWGFTAFWSLTFNPAKFHSVTAAIAEHMWKRVIVENLNAELFGHNYRRSVGHSYFGYVVGIEPHKSGALHMHALTTGRTHWSKACELWQAGKNLNVGTIHIRPIGDAEHDIRYALKYVTKGGELVLYRAERQRDPHFAPLWYLG